MFNHEVPALLNLGDVLSLGLKMSISLPLLELRVVARSHHWR